jgi:hypothetical protein
MGFDLWLFIEIPQTAPDKGVKALFSANKFSLFTDP